MAVPRSGPGPGCAVMGTTLLELVIVIAVLAVLLGLVVPSMQGLIARNRLKAAAQAVAEDLQWARSEAIKQNRPLELSLIADHWCYGVGAAGPARCDCRLPAGEPGACALKRVSAADLPGVRLSATFARTTFDPRRATAVNGSLTVGSPGGSALRVVLSRLGRVRICSPTNDVPGYDACGG
jgi:type IV fimbrial biogenesis protein FimT